MKRKVIHAQHFAKNTRDNGFTLLAKFPKPLRLILCLYLVAGILYATSAPYLDVSDEPRHYAMIERLARGEGFVVQNPATIGDPNDPRNPLQEGSQPPLYYLLMSVVAHAFDRSDFERITQFNPHAQLGRADTTHNFNQMLHTPAERFPYRGTVLAVMTMRVFGVLCGALAVACAYGIALFVAPHTPVVAPLAASLVAFNPMFLHIMASVNNDTLAAAMSSLALWLGAVLIRDGLTFKRAALLGLVLGCAGLAKASGLALVIVVPFFVFARLFITASPQRPAISLRHLFVYTALILLPVLAIAGWWYVRNVLLYGDPTGTQMMAKIAGVRMPPINSYFDLVQEWDGFYKAYWGLFGAVNIVMSDWIYPLFSALLVLAGIGLLLEIKDRRLSQPHPNPQMLTLLMCLSAFGVAFAALIQWTSITLASQGRLLFPVIVPIALFIALGICRLNPHRWVLAALCGGMAALAFATPFVYIRPAYATPALLTDEAQVLQQPNFTRTELFFEDSIRWIGFSVDNTRIHPTDTVNVTLYWQGLKPMPSNYSLFINVFARGGITATHVDTYPGGGMWQTTLWQPQQVIADRYRLRITDTLNVPTALWLDAGFWNIATKQFLATRDAAGNQTGRQRYLLAGVGSTQTATNNLTPVAVLQHAQVLSATAQQNGRTIDVNLRWLCTADFAEEYVVFRQLFAANGQPIPNAQADGPTMNGDFPTRFWRKGDVIDDHATLQLPDNLPAGTYTVRVGLYKPSGNFERMPATDATGTRLKDDAIELTISVIGN